MTGTNEQLLGRLELLKTCFGPDDGAAMLELLRTISHRTFKSVSSLIRLHEALLFVSAYPHNRAVLSEAHRILGDFHFRVEDMRDRGIDLSELEEAEVSGIAGTGMSCVSSFGMARHLARRYPSSVSIDWEYYTKPEHMGRALPRVFPLLAEDSMVEAVVPYREWVERGISGTSGSVKKLIDNLSRQCATEKEAAEVYDSLELMLHWELNSSPAARTLSRLPCPRIYYHRGPLISRRDVSLESVLSGPPLPVERVPRKEAEQILDLIRDTSAVRFRELHGFTWGDPSHMLCADAGRGLRMYVLGARSEFRLPLRAYHGGMFFKNGVPIGYVEVLSLFERMEVGFNLYYTFREGETAWLFANMLRLFRQLLGVTCFSIDPYQIGYKNQEGIDSGAFWFYRKLGFRPVVPKVAELCAAEEEKMRSEPGYRSSDRTLGRLAEGHMIYEAPGTAVGDWDRFQVRNLGLAVQDWIAKECDGDAAAARKQAVRGVAHALGVDPSAWPPVRQAGFQALAMVLALITDLARWTEREKKLLIQVLQSKTGPDEAPFLRRMQRHARLRGEFIRLGSG